MTLSCAILRAEDLPCDAHCAIFRCAVSNTLFSDIGGKLGGSLEGLANLVDVNMKEVRTVLGVLQVVNLSAGEFMFTLFRSTCDVDLIDVTGMMKGTMKNMEMMSVGREGIFEVTKSG